MYFSALCMRAGKSLDSLHICAGSPELSLLINVISAGSFVMLKGQNQLKQIVIEVYTHPVFSRKLFMQICFHASQKKFSTSQVYACWSDLWRNTTNILI